MCISLCGLRGALVSSLCFAWGIHLELIPRTVAFNLYCVFLSQAIYTYTVGSRCKDIRNIASAYPCRVDISIEKYIYIYMGGSEN